MAASNHGRGGEAASNTEREVKLGVWPGFTLPDLTGVAEGTAVVGPHEHRLDAVYHDTADLRLARAGVTVRHRRGDEPPWTVKLPLSPGPGPGDAGAGLARRELGLEGGAGEVPAEAVELVRALARSAPLRPVARLRTLRRTSRVLDGEGRLLVEVADDEVSVLEGRRVAARFREVEAELADGAPAEVVEAVVARLRDAGAGTPDPTPKVVRALGPRAAEPPDLAPVPVAPDASAAEVLRASLVGAALRIVEHHPAVVLGTDPEGVHQARVGTRRLRSDLRTYAALLDEGWVAPLRAGLRWLAAVLGEARDADVLLGRLRAAVAALPPDDREAAGALLAGLEARAGATHRGLGAALGEGRYLSLLDDLVEAARRFPTRPAGGRPAVEVLPGLARGPWERLRGAARRAAPGRPDDDLHRLRVLAKRCRYAADAAAPVVGRPAVRFAWAVAHLQEVLGEHQDAVGAERWLRAAAVDQAGPTAFAAGRLAAGQRAEAHLRRAAWTEAWEALDRPKLRRWMGS